MKPEGRGNAGLMDSEENQKQVSHFPTCWFSVSKPNQEGGLAADRFAPAFRLILRLENALVAHLLN